MKYIALLDLEVERQDSLQTNNPTKTYTGAQGIKLIYFGIGLWCVPAKSKTHEWASEALEDNFKKVSWNSLTSAVPH